MTRKILFLLAGLSLTITSPAHAAPSASLAIGGYTIAGPGKTSLGVGASGVVYTNDQGDTDACATVVNGGRGAIRVTVVGGGTGTVDVAVGATAAICRDDVSEIELTCLGVGTSSCVAQWRIDRD